MNLTLKSRRLSGEVRVPSSKSAAHRALIAAAFAKGQTHVKLSGFSDDILKTASCLSALGATLSKKTDGYFVTPMQAPPAEAVLDCGESGSTLRFLMPICAALGVHAKFVCHGRLAERPMEDLITALSEHGISFFGSHEICGKLSAGIFSLNANVSSQYLTGLLFALSLLEKNSEIHLTTKLESASYVRLTTDILRKCKAEIRSENDVFFVRGISRFTTPSIFCVEGDYSAASFWLGTGVRVSGLSADSTQGDSAILALLDRMGAAMSAEEGALTATSTALLPIAVDATDIPDLVPPLAVLCATANGESRITGAARLRFKESDRIESTLALLRALGADAEALPDGLLIRGNGHLSGGTVDAMGDHRIAMSAALASHFADGDITVLGAECVNKSYPAFWKDFEKLGGIFHQV